MTIRIACIGDSLTNGATGTGSPYPLQLREKLSSQYDPHNWGYGSTGTAVALNPLWRKQASQQAYDIVVVWTGVNDLGTLTSAQIYANLATLYREIQESGAKVIACAISPFGNAVGWSAAKQTSLEEVNVLIQTGDYIDVYVDLYRELEDTTTAGDLLAAYDSGDGIHVNDDGKDRVATLVAYAIEQVSNPFWIMANRWGLTTLIHPSWVYGTDINGTFAIAHNNRCSDGSNCKGLLDFCSGAIDFTQTGAGLWPLYRVGVRNGCAAAEFDGSDDFMAGGNKLAIAYNTVFSLWFVVKCASTGTQTILSKHDGAAGYEISYDGTNLTLEMTNTAASNSLIVAFPMDLHSDYGLVELHSTGAGTAAGITCRKNRAVVAGTASVNNLSATIATASNVTIGARAGGASQWMDGFFGALAYGAALSPWAKWAVTYALAKQFGFLRLYAPGELPTPAQVETGVGFGYDDTQYTGTLAAGGGGGRRSRARYHGV